MQPALSSKGFLVKAIDRYHKFLHLMKVHGYEKHFFVPSYGKNCAPAPLQ